LLFGTPSTNIEVQSGRGRFTSVTPCERAAGMDERFDVYRGGECVMRGVSLRQAAELLNIEMFDLAETILKYGRCVVGEFSAAPSEDWPAST
jgi:hypothetical protein